MNITKEQYRNIDLFIFAILTAVLELLNGLAINRWFPAQIYGVSVFLPIVLLVLMRWNGWASIHAIIAGVVYCICNNGTLAHYCIYVGGNLFVLLVLILFKVVGKKKLISRWYWTVIMSVCAFICVQLGRAAIASLFGNPFFAWLLQSSMMEMLWLFICVGVLLIARRQNGLFEDQIAYLIRTKQEEEHKNTPPTPITKQGYDDIQLLQQSARVDEAIADKDDKDTNNTAQVNNIENNATADNPDVINSKKED